MLWQAHLAGCGDSRIFLRYCVRGYMCPLSWTNMSSGTTISHRSLSRPLLYSGVDLLASHAAMASTSAPVGTRVIVCWLRRDNLPTGVPPRVLRPHGWLDWSMVRESPGCSSLMAFGTLSPLARPGNDRSMSRRVSLRRISAGSGSGAPSRCATPRFRRCRTPGGRRLVRGAG